jgi:hypothetical protein
MKNVLLTTSLLWQSVSAFVPSLKPFFGTLQAVPLCIAPLHLSAITHEPSLKDQNPFPPLTPSEFVEYMLMSLRSGKGYQMLLDFSTHGWRSKIYDAVGAPASADERSVRSALKVAMTKPHNQFAILVEGEDFEISFPSDPVDYDDGTCWVECRLRASDDELLVAMGCQLQQRQTDDAWLISSIDWQDFREPFYPGVGREEWTRLF